MSAIDGFDLGNHARAGFSSHINLAAAETGHGSLTGSAIETEDSIAFSALQDIRATIETVPLANARDV